MHNVPCLFHLKLEGNQRVPSLTALEVCAYTCLRMIIGMRTSHVGIFEGCADHKPISNKASYLVFLHIVPTVHVLACVRIGMCAYWL